MARRQKRARRYVINVPMPKELYDAVKASARAGDRNAAQWARYVFREATKHAAAG